MATACSCPSPENSRAPLGHEGLGGALAVSSQQTQVLGTTSRGTQPAVGCCGGQARGSWGRGGWAMQLWGVPVGQKRKREGWPSSWYTSLATEA